MSRRVPGLLVTLAGAAVALTACTANDMTAVDPSTTSTATRVAVLATDDECTLSASEVPSGPVVFSIENAGSDVTEFYVFAADGVTIETEVENIGPGLTREAALTLAPGDVVAACKPGMTGDGIRTPLTVTDSGADVATPTVDPTDGDD